MSTSFVTEHRDYLKLELAARVKRRPLYSQRAFARDIGLSPSSLTDYLKGNMRLSNGRILQIGKSIGLNSEQALHWSDLVESKFAKSDETRKLSALRANNRIQAQAHSISMDEFKIISEWFHFAYLELIEMNTAKYSDLKVAAKALALPVRSLKIAVKRLERVRLLRVDTESGHYQVDSSTQVGDSVPSEAIRQYHKQLLQKATTAMDTQDFNLRVNSSTMIAVPQEDVPKMVAELRGLAMRFLDPYIAQAQNKPKDKLYCLSLHFFDLMNKEKSR